MQDSSSNYQQDRQPTVEELLNGAEINFDEVEAALCLVSLEEFVKRFWDTIVPNPLIWNWHLSVLCEEIQAIDERVFLELPRLYDLIVNIPPGTSKTKIIAILSTAWEFARKPGIKVFVGSYSDMAVQAMADEIKLVMKSEKYLRFFPKTAIRPDRDSLHNFRTTENGEFYAFTLAGTLTSKHADILKIDDPLNPKETASDDAMTKTNDFFQKTLPTRKVNKSVTPTILVMQRLHFNDPTGYLMSKPSKRIRHICLPGEIRETSELVSPRELVSMYQDDLLDPARLGWEELDDLMTDLGSEQYAGQISQNPIPPGGLVWGKWFVEVPDYDFPEARWGWGFGTDWDLAYTEKKKNSASAYITTFRYKNKIYIDDFDFRWLAYPQLIAWMRTIPGPHYIERKATGQSAAQSLNHVGIPAIEFPVPGGTDKISRAKMATPKAEAGLICIRKSLADRFYNDQRQGILRFPKGKYQDVADVLAQAIHRQSGGGARILDDTINAEEDILEALGY